MGSLGLSFETVMTLDECHEQVDQIVSCGCGKASSLIITNEQSILSRRDLLEPVNLKIKQHPSLSNLKVVVAVEYLSD